MHQRPLCARSVSSGNPMACGASVVVYGVGAWGFLPSIRVGGRVTPFTTPSHPSLLRRAGEKREHSGVREKNTNRGPIVPVSAPPGRTTKQLSMAFCKYVAIFACGMGSFKCVGGGGVGYKTNSSPSKYPKAAALQSDGVPALPGPLRSVWESQWR